VALEYFRVRSPEDCVVGVFNEKTLKQLHYDNSLSHHGILSENHAQFACTSILREDKIAIPLH